MIIHHFKAKFRAILSREKRKYSSLPSLQFFNPIPKEITLFEIKKIKSRNFKEEQAGIYFLPLEKGFSKSCSIYLLAEDNLKLESSNLRDLICFPLVGDNRTDVRHLSQTKFSKTNEDWIIWEGEAIFTYLEEEPIVPEVTTLVVTNADDTIVTPIGGSDLVNVPNDYPWWRPDAADVTPRKNSRFYKGVETSFHWGLLTLGIILLFVNPILGMLILFWAFYSLTQKGGSNFSSSSSPTIAQSAESSSGESISTINPSDSKLPNGAKPSQPIKNRPSKLGLFLSILLSLPVLFFLWAFLPSLFWILLGALMLYVFGFFSPSKGWLYFSRILYYFLLVLSILFLLGLLIQNLELLPQVVEDTETDTRTEKVRDSTTNELLNKHSIVWENPHFTGKDQLTYFTGEQSYLVSKGDHAAVTSIAMGRSQVEYWNKVYNRLLSNDFAKVDSLARLVSSVAQERNYSQLQTSEYLITLIQEIPYVLVHDYSCQEVINNSNDFVREYHIDGKPCLPNIIAGLHSPYEFMHTLAGDCDTRSLFGHAVLTKLGISSSVWISEQYGHSILGVGVPVSAGVQKSVMGVPHYGVELTAKGYRLGMISPDQRNVKNWDIALYKNF